ncbi:MAG: HIT family protein [Phycisphaerales bacterium]|nr:HIT family protein [Phycisphaerales bacterium]
MPTPASPTSPTIFTRIIRGEIPCHQVYRDEQVLAFLDINPIAPGHTLVIPIEPAATMDALSDESAAALGRVLPRICRAVCAATGCADYNLLQNNGAAAHQAVFHVHVHIIPKPAHAHGHGSGLGIDWPARAIDHAAAAELARRIATHL